MSVPGVVHAERLDDAGLYLHLGNDLAAIAAALPAIEAFCVQAGLTPRVANRVEVVIEEIVSNAIRHGFAPGSAQSVVLTARATEDAVLLAFDDDGAAFDPLAYAEPAPFADLETAQVGGLGIAAVRRLATVVSYTAVGGNGFPVNRLEVTLAR